MELNQLEKICKALGDSNRLKILAEMAAGDGLIQCSRIMGMMDLAQPSVSHHIKTLTEAGLIKPVKDGRNYSYILNKALLRAFTKELSNLAGK